MDINEELKEINEDLMFELEYAKMKNRNFDLDWVFFGTSIGFIMGIIIFLVILC